MTSLREHEAEGIAHKCSCDDTDLLAFSVLEVKVRVESHHGEQVLLHVLTNSISVAIVCDIQELLVLDLARVIVEKNIKVDSELPEDQV